MSATKERRHIRHDKAQAIEDSPGDTDSFEPGAAFIHRPSGTGEVHEQQGYRSSDDGGDSGDGKDLGVYILHDLFEDTYLSNPDYDKKEDIIIDVEDADVEKYSRLPLHVEQ